METLRWTIRDLEFLPDDGKRYEVVDGELLASKQPDWQHQFVSGRLFAALQSWSDKTRAGVANLAPGLIFTDDTAVVPDVIWISRERLKTALQADGKLHSSPALVAEVLSPGSDNARRDREVKLKLYSRRGVQEYWVLDWQERRIEVYRRSNSLLVLEKTLNESDTLQSPLLPEFSCTVNQLFTSF